MVVRKRPTFQMTSSSSDTSGTSSSSSSSSPLRRFNHLLRSSLVRHWSFFKRSPDFKSRERSISDAGLCSVVEQVPGYLNDQQQPIIKQLRRSFHGTTSNSASAEYASLPKQYLTSAGGSSSAVLNVEEPNEASDCEKKRGIHHLRVPSPHHQGSTGNFASSGVAGGAAGSPRSAPTTPLQIEPQPPPRTKHDKQNDNDEVKRNNMVDNASFECSDESSVSGDNSEYHNGQVIKPISTSAPSVPVAAFPHTSVSVSAGDGGSDASESGKAPSKARQKKFLRHFPQVGPEEKVLNYYSCALVGDILLQGHLYITKNYFAFYSNVFGYVTKLLIPTTSVVRVTKEKVARIIPNAVGVCTRDERHVFGSLLSRDSAHKLMTRVWKGARVERPLPTPPPSELRISEAELDASEYSPEDESSSGGGETRQNGKRRDSPAILHPVAGTVTAVIQPALLTGASVASISRGGGVARALLMLAALLLAISAGYLAFRLYSVTYYRVQVDLSQLSGEDLYEELLRWRTKVHGKAASELEAFLSTNLLLLTKVRQSLEALSGIMLADIGNVAPTQLGLEVPNDTYS